MIQKPKNKKVPIEINLNSFSPKTFNILFWQKSYFDGLNKS